MITARQLKKAVFDLEISYPLYINALGLSSDAIDLLRKCVKSGVLVPDKEMVKRAYKDVDSVMCGDVIIPQMEYYRRGDD